MIEGPDFLSNFTAQKHISTFGLFCFGVLVTMILLSCASSPPSKTLPQAQVAVDSIDHTNFRKFLENDINVVKNKLEQAQKFEANKDHQMSEQLAQQILADVEWIRIKTQRMTVKQEVQELEDSVTNLNEELKWREPIDVAPLK